jgi:acetyl esterase/lipase
MMRWYWRAYAPDPRADDAELSPLAATDLSGLAAAIVLVAAVDVLRDDGLAYARRLTGHGVPVELVDCEGMIHGFLRWSEAVPAVRSHIDRACELARRRLLPGRPPRL